MSDTKEYAALQEECERLRAENQRLNKDLARYRAKYGELSEPDKGGEIEPQTTEAVKFDKNKISAQSSDSAIVTNQSPSEEKIKLFVRCSADGKIFMQSGGTAKRAVKAVISPSV